MKQLRDTSEVSIELKIDFISFKIQPLVKIIELAFLKMVHLFCITVNKLITDKTPIISFYFNSYTFWLHKITLKKLD